MCEAKPPDQNNPLERCVMRKRVYVLGLDGMMLNMYERFAGEGLLPNFKRLADNGVMTESYSSIPA